MLATKIHFGSGKIQEVFLSTEFEINKFVERLKGQGIRLMRDLNDERILLIPLNSTTLEFIEIPVLTPVVEKPVVKTEDEELTEMAEEMEKEATELDKMKDIEEKREEALKEIEAKSACIHKNTRLYMQETKSGPRYFPVCADCGFRMRYVKTASLSDTEITNATTWED